MTLFGSTKPVIGMTHFGALPRMTLGRQSLREIEEQALRGMKI